MRTPQIFSTAEDNQTTVTVHVVQGERRKAKENKTLGQFNLTDIPAAPRGMPQIEVVFDMDANAILNVSAKDKATGKEQNIKIEASSGLSDEEIEKMKQEAEANADADNKAKETADKINGADGMIFQTEKQLKEFGEKLSDDKKAPIEEALTELKSAHESKDLDAIDAAMEKINTAWTAASEEMYKASQEGGENPSSDGGNTESTDDVTDVEFEEVKED